MNTEFCSEFSYRDALGYEPGVTRRDPSPVIKIGTTYHVWYSKATFDDTGYYATVWHAVSPDGYEWTEQSEAISNGMEGDWDEHSVFTPTTLVAEGKYYLFYTAVPEPFTNDPKAPGGPIPTAIGAAVADAPDGPWRKFEGNPILRPGPACEFDSLRVDDACLIVRDGKYWLYYKGRPGKGSVHRYTPMGLAIAEHPTGPYIKHEANPLIESGHEVCVWPYKEGVAALVSLYGQDGGNIRYAADGIHFKKEATAVPPRAPGPFRSDNYSDVKTGTNITWGLCQDIRSKDRPFLLRFDCGFTGCLKSPYMRKHNYF